MWFPWRSKTNGDSKKALAEAQANVRKVLKRSDEVTELAESFKEFRERNHFAEQLENIIVRRRGRFQ